MAENTFTQTKHTNKTHKHKHNHNHIHTGESPVRMRVYWTRLPPKRAMTPLMQERTAPKTPRPLRHDREPATVLSAGFR